MKRTWLYAAAAFVIFAALFGKRYMTKKEWAARLKVILAEMKAAGELDAMQPDVLAALAAHESGWGTGRIFLESNNLFSITAGKWTGPTITSGAKDPSGVPYKFRMYPTWREAVRDFVALMRWSRYAPARAAAAAGNADAFARALARAGYGDPNDGRYAAKIVENFNAIRTA